jgi:hypothetical protein
MNRQLMKVCLIALLISLSASFTPYPNAASSLKNESTKRAALHDAMRKLWEDHITWTRVFIISAAGDLPDKATATDRLLQSQVDIGNAIARYLSGELVFRHGVAVTASSTAAEKPEAQRHVRAA